MIIPVFKALKSWAPPPAAHIIVAKRESAQYFPPAKKSCVQPWVFLILLHTRQCGALIHKRNISCRSANKRYLTLASKNWIATHAVTMSLASFIHYFKNLHVFSLKLFLVGIRVFFSPGEET